MLNAETSENITVAAALQQELETRHLPPIDLIPFDGNPLKWPEFIQSFKERVCLKKCFSDSMRMDRLLSALKGEAKNSIISIGTKGLCYVSALKSLKRHFGDTAVVANNHSSNSEISKMICWYCLQDHKPTACKMFISLNFDEKKTFVKEKQLFWNCLTKGHKIKDCTSTGKCRKDYCSKKITRYYITHL